MSKLNNIDQINFTKGNGLIPAIVQDATTNTVLMLGYMNKAALERSRELGKVTFYSRSKDRLWTKGETSGNYLELKDIYLDCDQDALLVKAKPLGPTCHTGSETCFGESNESNLSFLDYLTAVIQKRKSDSPENSYTASLFAKGINKMAQKVGEEAVEVVIEAKDNDDNLFINEASDLLFHYMVLLEAKGFTLNDVAQTLKQRHR